MRMWESLCGKMEFMSGSKQIRKYWWVSGMCNMSGQKHVISSKLDQENRMKSISGLAAIGCAVSLECSDEAGVPV